MSGNKQVNITVFILTGIANRDINIVRRGCVVNIDIEMQHIIAVPRLPLNGPEFFKHPLPVTGQTQYYNQNNQAGLFHFIGGVCGDAFYWALVPAYPQNG